MENCYSKVQGGSLSCVSGEDAPWLRQVVNILVQFFDLYLHCNKESCNAYEDAHFATVHGMSKSRGYIDASLFICGVVLDEIL